MTRMDPSEIITELSAQPDGSKLIILAAIPEEEAAEPARLLGDLQRQGFIRIREFTHFQRSEHVAIQSAGRVQTRITRAASGARRFPAIHIGLRQHFRARCHE